MNETQLVAAILKTLELKRYWAWRANAGITVVPGTGNNARRVIRGAPSGTPDILVVLPGNRLVGLEVKTQHGKLRPSQVAWQERADSFGVPYAVVRSSVEALRFLEQVKQ